MDQQTSKHPISLSILACIAIFQTFTFGTINSLLVLYLNHDFNLSSTQTYAIFAAFNSLVFTLPLAGGYLSGKFGYKQAIVVGTVFSLVGCSLVAAQNFNTLLIGLATFVVGLGLSVPSLNTLVDLSYAKDDTRRESGFTLYYLLMNIGFLLAAIVGGYLADTLGYRIALWVGASSQILLLGFFAFTHHLIRPFKGRSMDSQLGLSKLMNNLSLVGLSIIGIPLSVLLIHNSKIDDIFLSILVVAVSILVIRMAFQQKQAIARYKLFVFLILSFISIIFWALYTLEPSLLTIFIESNVDRKIFSTIIPAATFYGLDPLYIILFGIGFGALWKYLAQRDKDLSLPTKFASALIMIGLGFWVFLLGIKFVDSTHLVNMSWVFIGYLPLTIGELLIGPIGMAMVGRLSPPKQEGLLMGVWQLFTGFAAVISNYLADLAIVPKTGTAASTNPIYAQAFWEIGLAGMVVGVIAFALVPYIKGLLKE